MVVQNAAARNNQNVQTVQQTEKQTGKKEKGTVEVPSVSTPEYQTKGASNQNKSEQNQMTTAQSGYTPINASAAPGVNMDAHEQEVEKQKEYLANNDVAGVDKNAIYEQYADIINQTLKGNDGNSAKGYYTQDAAEAEKAKNQYGATVSEAEYNGQSDWYYVDGADRTTQEGTSGADEDLMSDGDYAILQQLKAEYAAAQKAGDTEAMEQAHQAAERLRMGYGYTGGEDGSQYLTLGELGLSDKQKQEYGESDSAAGKTGVETPDLTSLLEAWKQAAQEQSDGQIDYAVQQAITELERALEDAQPEYKAQAEAVAKDEMQALDNSALYAELRGDKGGIGKSQYNEIQAAAAQNRLAVQQAQTKLSTDTARQIADLRAQGEFEKADAALEISQQYLAQLISLEQWAAEFGLSAAQFNESVRQWEAEYDLAMKEFQVDTELSYTNLTGKLNDGTLTLSGQSQLASMGEAMLGAGIMPTGAQLSAMGMTEEQASAYLMALQLESASKTGGSKGTSSGNENEEEEKSLDEAMDELFSAAYASGNPTVYLNNTNSYKEYGLSSKTDLVNQYEEWVKNQNKNGNDLYNVDINGLAAEWKDMMEQYSWSPVSLGNAMRQRGYTDTVIDAVFAKLDL